MIWHSLSCLLCCLSSMMSADSKSRSKGAQQHSTHQQQSTPSLQQQQQQQHTPAPLPVVDSVLEYEKLHRIGEGTYGVVYKARHIPTGQIVALKKVRFSGSKEGLPVTSVRELAILQQARHPNIVSLLKVVTGTRPDSVFLVFEYVEHDLGRVLDSHAPAAFDHGAGSNSSHRSGRSSHPTAAAAVAPVGAFSEGEAKCLFKQLLSAVGHLHSRWILHRDLKLSNLLYSNTGQLKLCDFGLARHFSPDSDRLTPRVVTLWYRAPELLLGSDSYGPAIDAWALGCILGELLRGQPLFPASTEGEAIQMHCQLLGTPNTSIWPAMRSLPHASSIRWPDQPYNYLRRTFPELSAAGLSLLNGLLTYDATRRMTVAEALEHEYFRERPYPRRPQDMPTFASADAPAGSAPRHPDPAAKQHISEVVDAAYAAAGLPRPHRASDDVSGLHGAAGYSQHRYAGRAAAGEDGLPQTLYQRFDDPREMLEAPLKRPRPSGGY